MEYYIDVNTFKEIFGEENNIKNEFTITEISQLFNTSINTIKTIVKRHKKQFEKYKEIRLIDKEDLRSYKERFLKENKIFSPSLLLINLDGILRIALLMKNNKIAMKLKNKFLNEEIPDKYKEIFAKHDQMLLKQNIFYDSLIEVFNGVYSVQTQVKCGKYRIDAVIGNLAIECDECGHQNYSVEKEILRENYIISKGYKIIRYNPENDSFLSFLNNILRELKI